MTAAVVVAAAMGFVASGASVANASVAPTSFGDVLVGTTSVADPVSVSLDSGYYWAGDSVVGSGGGQFTVDSSGCSTAVGPTTCTLNVAFSPTALGTQTITLNSTECPESGTLGSCTADPATSPEFTGNGVSNFSATPAALSFGNQEVGTGGQQQSITITLDAGYQLSTTPDDVTGDYSSFSLDQSNCANVVGPSTCTVNVAFSPVAPGALSTSFSFVECPSNAYTSCLDLPGGPTMLGGTGTYDFSARPTNLNFGDQPINTSSTTQPITVTLDPGYYWAGFSESGSGVGQYTVDASNCQSVVGPTTCTLNVGFAPMTTGSQPVTLTTDECPESGTNVCITDPDGPNQFTGSGVTTFTARPTDLNFGAQAPDTSSPTQPITITLDAGFFWGGFSESGSGVGQFTVDSSDCSSPVVGPTTCTLNVGFSPTTTGVQTITFSTEECEGSASNGTLHCYTDPDGPNQFTGTGGTPPQFSSANSTAFVFGSAHSFTVSTTGSPTSTVSESGTLPAGVTFTANQDGTGTLSGTPTAGSPGVYPVTFTASNGVGADVTQAFTLTVQRATPTISWATPAAITYGTGLSGAQLDATASVPGNFSYTPGLSTVLPAGDRTLSLTFTPTDTTDYAMVTTTVQLQVNPAPLTVTASSATMTYGSSPPAITPSYAGFVNGDTDANLSPAASCTTTATTSSNQGSYPSTCSGAADPNYTINYVHGTVTVIAASTGLSYTGATEVSVSSSFNPAAEITSPAAGCVASQPVTFSLASNPTSGAATSYTLGAASTNSSGAANAAAVSTTGWQIGVYQLTAAFAGTANCSPSTTTVALTVTTPGAAGAGTGWYTVPNVGPTNFGFVVTVIPHTTSYAGKLAVSTGKWWFVASVASFARSSSTTGLLSGIGSLYWWSPSLHGGSGGWQLAKSGVSYTATANEATKTSPASFGITIKYLPVAPQPTLLPNSSAIALIKGFITLA